jgi:hypothetical protein
MTGFVFQDKYLDRLAKLSDQEVGRLVRALAVYHASGEEPELKGRECGYFDFIKGDIDEIEQAYQKKCNNMKREQLTAIAPNCPQLTSTADNINKKENINKKDIKETPLKGSKEKRERFSPPTVEDVSEYCKERGNKVDPNRFVDFYASKGWKVGQNPMKDWKAAVRTWEQRDEHPAQAPGKVVSAARYDQRPYDEKALEDQLGVNDIFSPDWKGAS